VLDLNTLELRLETKKFLLRRVVGLQKDLAAVNFQNEHAEWSLELINLKTGVVSVPYEKLKDNYFYDEALVKFFYISRPFCIEREGQNKIFFWI
jgi:hypothetical protein